MTDSPRRAPRWPRWLLVCALASVVMYPAIITSVGIGTHRYPNPVAPWLVSLAIGALQLRHSLATARGERPRGGMWTLLAMAVLVYAPMWWFGYQLWQTAPAALIASAPMVLRGRGGPLVAAAVAALVGGMTATVEMQSTPRPSAAELVYTIVTADTVVVLYGVFLYGAARLVRIHDQLHATRDELAELAIGQERLRLSRDLHDLLGQSLSAIALKGDLAIRLLHIDPPTARAEIGSLTTVAREALRDIYAVARDEHKVSLRSEIDGAATLLNAAGIATRIELDPVEMAPPTEETLAWAVREGVANLLRHSNAHTCSITATRRNGTLRLEIVNDNARPATRQGHGLAGLAERARALSGTVTAKHDTSGRFCLLVEIPEEAT